jgi:hypothetical protein
MGGLTQVLRYLGRYIHRVAISNHGMHTASPDFAVKSTTTINGSSASLYLPGWLPIQHASESEYCLRLTIPAVFLSAR